MSLPLACLRWRRKEKLRLVAFCVLLEFALPRRAQRAARVAARDASMDFSVFVFEKLLRRIFETEFLFSVFLFLFFVC